MVPSFLPTKSIGAPNGDLLGSMNPLLRSSCTVVFNSLRSDGVSLYIALNGGWELGTKSMVCSLSLDGGSPEGRS